MKHETCESSKDSITHRELLLSQAASIQTGIDIVPRTNTHTHTLNKHNSASMCTPARLHKRWRTSALIQLRHRASTLRPAAASLRVARRGPREAGARSTGPLGFYGDSPRARMGNKNSCASRMDAEKQGGVLFHRGRDSWT